MATNALQIAGRFVLKWESGRVFAALDRKNRRVLMRTGAYGRTAMKREIRPRKQKSRPDSPPHSHTGTLRRLMRFDVDSANKSVVIGPQMFNGEVRPMGGKTGADLLNVGGGAIQTLPGDERPVLAEYQPRPFTPRPFEATWQKFQELVAREKLR